MGRLSGERVGSLVIAAALVAGVAACDGSGLGSGSDYSVQGALAQLPAGGSDGQVMVMTGDLVGATEAAGLERPDSLDSQALIDWIGPLTGLPGEDGLAPVFVPVASLLNVNQLASHQEFADELGFSILDVESFAESSTPPEVFTVLAGDVELSPDLPEIADGVVTAGEGEDFAPDVQTRTVARPFGVPLRLAQRDGVTAAAPGTDAVIDWLAGPEETLADHEGLNAVGGALDEVDVVSAVLVTGSSMALADVAGAQASAEQIAQLEATLVLPPAFTSVGVGWGADGGEPVITLAYYFGSDADAEAAVPAFETMFAEARMIASGLALSDLLVLEDAAQDGQVVTLTVSPADDRPVATVFTMLQTGDLPFVHR